MNIIISIFLVFIAGSIVNGILKFGLGAFLLLNHRPAAWLLLCAILGAVLPFLSALLGISPSVPFWACVLTLFVRVAPGISGARKGSIFRKAAIYLNVGMALFAAAVAASYFISYGELCDATGNCSRIIAFLER